MKEKPYKNPDTTLFKLLDSYVVKYCIVPSIINGMVNTEIEYLIVIKGHTIFFTPTH